MRIIVVTATYLFAVGKGGTFENNAKYVKDNKTPVLDATDKFHPLETPRDYQLTNEELLHDHIVGQPIEGIAHAVHEFEKFSQKHGLGLTMGDQKGGILEHIIDQAMSELGSDEPVNVLEMGSHIGDGSLRILNTIMKKPSSNLVAIEPDNHWHSIGPKIVRHAVRYGADSRANSMYHPFMFPHDLFDFADTLAQNHGVQKFHIVLMDHGDHTTFKDDIEKLIKAGAIAPGAKIIVDNAHTKAAQKADYFGFVRDSGHFEASETIPVTAPYKDAIHVATFKKRDEL